MHLFPDVHIVTLVSKMSSPSELMRWWVDVVIGGFTSDGSNLAWVPVDTRALMVECILSNIEDGEIFSSLIPGWPSPTAGGCRYINTARSFIVDRLPMFRRLDADMWPPCYKEQYCLFLFGRRGIDPNSSPTAPTTSTAIAPNPGLEGMLRGPAASLSCGKLGDSIAPGFSLRCRILEYARAFPLEAARFLRRLEESKEAATRMLPYDQKRRYIVWDLRDLLTLLGVPLYRPSNWEDHYPPLATGKKRQLYETAADLKITSNRKKAHSLLDETERLSKALLTEKRDPPPRLDLRSDLKNILHPKGPGDPSKDEELYLRIGTPAKSREPRKRLSGGSRKRSHSTSARGVSDLRDHLHEQHARRAEGQHHSTTSPQFAIPETITSGAYEASLDNVEGVVVEAPTVVPRKVHFRDYQQRIEIRPPTDTEFEEPTAKRSSFTAAAAFIHIERPPHRFVPPSSYSSQDSSFGARVAHAPVATINDCDIDGMDASLSNLKHLSVNIRRLFVVGGEQAKRLSWGLAALLRHLEVKFVNVPSPDMDGYNTAADELTRYDLTRSYVFAWLYDERCFIQANSGSGLCISTYDNTIHCPGRVGIINRDQLTQLCDESVHLLHGMQDAAGSTIITPLPFFLINPCCELPDHCPDAGNTTAAKAFCSDIVALTSVVQRWASQKGFARTSVLCPHLELLLQIKADPWKDWIQPLQECFGREATNFSRRGYSHLAKQMWERVEEKLSDDRVLPDWRRPEERATEQDWDTDSSTSVQAQSGRRPFRVLFRNREQQPSGSSSMFKPSNYPGGQCQSPDIDWD